MPEATELPVSMRALISYNGVNWVHEYQSACVDKIERFLKTEKDSVEITNEKVNPCFERKEPEGMVSEGKNTVIT